MSKATKVAAASNDLASQLEDVPLTSFVHAARVDVSELDLAEVTEKEIRAVNDIEDAWARFLLGNPDALKRSDKNQRRVDKLQHRVDAVKANQDKMAVEMGQQLDLIHSHKEDVENAYRTAMDQHKSQQAHLDRVILDRQDLVALADQKIMDTLSWQCFFESLDFQVDNASLASDRQKKPDPDDGSDSTQASPTAAAKANAIRPSSRAMYLVDESVGSRRDVDFRAFQIDNALLRAQIRLMHKKMDGMQLYTESLKHVGKFMTENSIWSVMSEFESPQSKRR